MSRDPRAPFRLGVNYWPARTAMGWWSDFDLGEVERDFARLRHHGLDSVRIFLTWEDFQPTPTEVHAPAVSRLVATLDAARDAQLLVMPTLFTGHMSGVNWFPPWALGGAVTDPRFRVVSGGRVSAGKPASWYADGAILRAQCLLARALAEAVAGHETLLAWDLGNENSNCVVPESRAQGREWLLRISSAIRDADPRARITVGLHMEDLAEDRRLGPREAAEVSDFLTMHGYPGYAPWSDGPTDERVLPFLARLTRWLGGGVDVLFSEMGVPTAPRDAPPLDDATYSHKLVDEDEAAAYVARAVSALHACGSTGAMLWCHSDYAEALFTLPPLDLAPHERTFGLFRADGSAKPAVAALASIAKQGLLPTSDSALPDATWLDVDAEAFYAAPATELPRLYRRYCDAGELTW